MNRKVCSIGNSKGVSIPAEFLGKLELAVGSEVDISLDETSSKIVIEPVRGKKYPQGIDKKFVSQINEFMAKYKPALKELAKK